MQSLTPSTPRLSSHMSALWLVCSASGGGGLELDGVLYRCAVSLSEASSLAQLWRFDLLSYLHHST